MHRRPVIIVPVAVLLLLIVVGLLAGRPTKTKVTGAGSLVPSSTSTTPAAAAGSWTLGGALTREAAIAELGHPPTTLGKSLPLAQPAGLAIDVPTGTVEITYPLNPGAPSDSSALDVGSQTAYSASRAMFANPTVNEVIIVITNSFADANGDARVGRALVSVLTRPTVAKVNWADLATQVSGDNKAWYCQADALFIHHAIAAHITNPGCLGAAYNTSDDHPAPRPSTPPATQAPTTPPPATTPPTTAAPPPAPTTEPSTTPVRGPTCGAPANPMGYNLCGRGSPIYNPDPRTCNYFRCIANFSNGTGYMEECQDGMYSMSGGHQGACSHHSGEAQAVSSGP